MSKSLRKFDRLFPAPFPIGDGAGADKPGKRVTPCGTARRKRRGGASAQRREAERAVEQPVHGQPLGDAERLSGTAGDQFALRRHGDRLMEPGRTVAAQELVAETAPVERPVAHRTAVEMDEAGARIPADAA